jgi:tripartite-type tricarboxylate transporter receptor subunit TctC
VALAGEYPDRPIRIVTPFPAGSATDIVARPIAAQLSEKWSQPVVVDNRSGAGGTISAEIVAKSPPDGHTLLIGATGPNTVNPALIKSMPYDSVRAFAPVTILATNNLLLTVPLSLPVTSVKELIELAHSKRDNFVTDPAASAPCRISPANYSRQWPASISFMCRIKAVRNTLLICCPVA